MSKKMLTPGIGGGNKPAQALIPDDILPFCAATNASCIQARNV